MDYIGIDLHKTSSQVCILTEDGELIERRIKTDKESFARLFAGKPQARILFEASSAGNGVAPPAPESKLAPGVKITAQERARTER